MSGSVLRPVGDRLPSVQQIHSARKGTAALVYSPQRLGRIRQLTMDLERQAQELQEELQTCAMLLRNLDSHSMGESRAAVSREHRAAFQRTIDRMVKKLKEIRAAV